MNRIRIGCFITLLIGTMYASAGLFTNVTDFAIGVIVASVGLIGIDLVEWLS